MLTNKNSRRLLVACVLAPFLLCKSGLAQDVEIVDQTNRSGLAAENLVWDSSEKWIATLDGRAGLAYIFDLTTGRFSRQVQTPGTDYSSVLDVIPSKDRIVVKAADIRIYDVISGVNVAVLEGSEGCSFQSVTVSEVSGGCTSMSRNFLKPTTSSQKAWDPETGKLLPEAPGYHSDAKTNVGNETWAAFRGVSMAKAIFSKTPKAGTDATKEIQHAQGMYRFTIRDTSTQQVIMQGDGTVSALSKHAQTAIVSTKDGVFLVQVPSGKRIKKFGEIIATVGADLSGAQTTLGGTQYLITGPAPFVADAVSGDTTPIDLPGRGSAYASPSGTRVAFLANNAITVYNLPDISQKVVIGTPSDPTNAPDMKNYFAENRAEAAERQKQNDEEAKQEAKTLQQLLQGKKSKKTDSGDTEQDDGKDRHKKGEGRHGRQTAQAIENQQRASLNRVSSDTHSYMDSPAQKDYAEKLWKSYSKFPGPIMQAPAAEFRSSQNVMAVLAADLSWNLWDINTGNRIPTSTVPVNFVDIYGQSSGGGLNGSEQSRLYTAMKARLDTPSPRAATRTLPASAPSSSWGCSSPSGSYLVDFKAELDPKKWQQGQHAVTAAFLRSADGTSIDLLAKNIDLSLLAAGPSMQMPSSVRSAVCGLSDDGKLLAVERRPTDGKTKKPSRHDWALEAVSGKQTSESVALYETSTGKMVCELEGSRNLDAAAGTAIFSPNLEFVALGGNIGGIFSQLPAFDYKGKHPLYNVYAWDTKSCKKVLESPGHVGGVVGFSQDGRELLVHSTKKMIGEQSAFGVQVLEVPGGKELYTLPDINTETSFLRTTPNGRVLIAPERDKSLGFWGAHSGEKLGSMRALQEGEWLVTTPSGYFDGSPRGWSQIAWRVPGEGLKTQPGEIFFNDFYRPGLLAELLQGEAPKAPRAIDQVDRRQPMVQIKASSATTSDRTVNITITAQEAAADSQHKDPTGVHDVRLFRNGSLVKAWRGAAKLQAGQVDLEANVAVNNGANEFAAYAFNGDNVKSADATTTVQSTAPNARATTYVLSIGINQYQNPEFNLKFAAPDAEVIADRVAEKQMAMNPNQELVSVVLKNEEATKANLMLALATLSGEHQGAVPRTAPKQLARLKAAQPQDLVVIYFAGHGIAWGDHFYLVPHDLGYSGPRNNVQASIETVLQHSISDQNLESALEPLQAGHALLIIDACNSGKVLDSDEQRRGPMNNRGLAQLAYEKGMYILTAAQSYQAAIETERLGHGYLTFALAEEGLKTPIADTEPQDGKLTAIEWFDYASRRVPELQIDATSNGTPDDRLLVLEAGKSSSDSSAPKTTLQTPRFYYRRDLTGLDTIMATFR